MDPIKSLDEYKLIAAALYDIHMSYGVCFNRRARRLTCNKIKNRMRSEGLGFLTKSLPRLGKAFDKALCGIPLDAIKLGFKPKSGSKLPMLLGELFEKVLHPDGTVLPSPCAKCVKIIRQITYLFYKYELPYDTKQEQEVVLRFERTEADLSTHSDALRSFDCSASDSTSLRRSRDKATYSPSEVVTRARRLLERVFSGIDLTDIVPKHGPGAVAGKQLPWDKFRWTNLPSRLAQHFPFDAFFCASAGHVCDTYREFDKLSDSETSARVLLVPKDSRGPRLISCEPVEFQWIQQGVAQVIVRQVERALLTKYNVFFTDQLPNRIGALYGSSTGKYATLDLNEASDRVSVDLVRLLFPPSIFPILESCRSLGTVLPDGKYLKLQKFAPMGSALCFPILALTVWSILTAAAPDAETRKSIHVYGDDVIVPTAYAVNAMEQLELFGLKVNRDKSCISGLFRESCGMDAFQGIPVTPVRFRTVWSWSPSPDVYTSWIAYANQMWDIGWFNVYNEIVERLNKVYNFVPDQSLRIEGPSLRYQPDSHRRYMKKRWNRNLQRFEYRVLGVRTPIRRHELDGWSMLLRWFTEGRKAQTLRDLERTRDRAQYNYQVALDTVKFYLSPHDAESTKEVLPKATSLSVSQYTKRGTSMLVPCWR